MCRIEATMLSAVIQVRYSNGVASLDVRSFLDRA